MMNMMKALTTLRKKSIMNREQYLLTKLSEECMEIGKEALKIQQFGFNSYNPEEPNVSNKQRLINELNDLMAIIELLNEDTTLNYSPHDVDIAIKKDKVDKFYNLSSELGYCSKQHKP